MRIIIIAGLIYLLYRALKRWLAIDVMSMKKSAFPQSGDQLDDLMVQDPHCGTFLPKHQGVKAHMDGKELIFCSENCRDSYLKQKQKDTTS